MTQPTQADPEPGVPSVDRRLVFAVTALGAFMASLDLSIVNVAFPALERTFSGDSRATLAWVITGYSIVFGALLVVAGRTADRLGSRRVFFAGLGVFCVGSLLCGLAPTVGLLVAGRLVQGLGAAALLPSSLALLLGAFPSERRSQVVALWGGIGALAVATGPSVGALLITGFELAGRVLREPARRPGGLVGRPQGAGAQAGGGVEGGPGLPRRRHAGRVAGRPRPGHLAGSHLGLDEPVDPGLLRRERGVDGRLRHALVAPPRTRTRPTALPVPFVHRGQPRHPALRHGVLRHAARQHPVPHQRLGLLDPAGRPGRHPGPAGRRRGVRARGQAGRADRLPAGPARRVRRLRLRPGLVCAPHRCRARLPRGLAARDPGRRPRHRTHLPGTQRRRRLLPRGRPLRGGQRRQPDGAPGGWCARGRRAGGDPGGARPPRPPPWTPSTTCGGTRRPWPSRPVSSA